MNNDKKIIIDGINNKYQIKKLLKNKTEIKKRKEIEKEDIPIEYFNHDMQYKLMNHLYENISENISENNINTDDNIKKIYYIIKSHIIKKINSYKQQDILKKRFEPEKMITYSEVIGCIYDEKMECYYCKVKIMLLYENVREMTQWSLDRINNDIGHNKENVVISCLKCNLKRKKINSDSFLFTKQMNIIKMQY